MKRVGRYKLLGQLGRGGMSSVFKVEMPVTGKVAAMKLLKPDELMVDLMGMENIRNLFFTEAVTMANLRHPNLVDVWDCDEHKGRPFYIMEYFCNNLGTMIGESYETEKPSRVLRVDKAVHYTREVLSGLACLHHAGIIHRDIKPFNILVTDFDTVKICDFGLSKLRGETFRGPSNLKVGTPWYAAPEQEQDPDTVTFSADLFPVGVMLYRMLTGILPMENPRKPSRANPDLDEDWDALILKAIDPDPEQRFQSARDMSHELEAVAARWEEKQEKVCAVPVSEWLESGPPRPLSEPLRRQGIKVRPQNARERFGLDELWRPAEYIRNEVQDNGDGTVTDRTTGLVWEQSGSEYPMTWQEAGTCIEELNITGFAGRTDWRLPTVEELMSLLREIPHGRELCIEPVFDRTQKWLWSCDRRSHIGAWYVSLDLGFVASQDFTGYYHVRGVSGGEME